MLNLINSQCELILRSVFVFLIRNDVHKCFIMLAFCLFFVREAEAGKVKKDGSERTIIYAQNISTSINSN